MDTSKLNAGIQGCPEGSSSGSELEPSKTPLSVRLKKVREDVLRVGQKEAASLWGVGVSTLQRYEWGERAFDVSFAEKVCASAGVRLDWLIRGEEPMLRGDIPALEGGGVAPSQFPGQSQHLAQQIMSQHGGIETASSVAMAEFYQRGGTPEALNAHIEQASRHAAAEFSEKMKKVQSQALAALTQPPSAEIRAELQRRTEARSRQLWFFLRCMDRDPAASDDSPLNSLLLGRTTDVLNVLSGGTASMEFLMAHPHLVDIAADLALAYEAALKSGVTAPQA